MLRLTPLCPLHAELQKWNFWLESAVVTHFLKACETNIDISHSKLGASCLQFLQEVRQGRGQRRRYVVRKVSACVVSRPEAQPVLEEGLDCLAALL